MYLRWVVMDVSGVHDVLPGGRKKTPRVMYNSFLAPNTQGFRELLKYAGFAWAIETDLAPAEDTTSYWKTVPPIWQVWRRRDLSTGS